MIYTKKGDDGSTELVDGTRVSKSHPKIVIAGKIDSIVAYLALVKLVIKNQSILITDIQKYLMQLVNNLEITNLDLILKMEEQINQINFKNEWSYPAGNLKAAIINITRTQVRELEVFLVSSNVKNSIPFLNRLSDYIFALYKNFEST